MPLRMQVESGQYHTGFRLYSVFHKLVVPCKPLGTPFVYSICPSLPLTAHGQCIQHIKNTAMPCRPNMMETTSSKTHHLYFWHQAALQH